MTVGEAEEVFLKATGGALHLFKGQKRMTGEAPVGTLCDKCANPTAEITVDNPDLTAGEFEQMMKEVLGVTARVMRGDQWSAIPKDTPLCKIKETNRMRPSHYLEPLKEK